MWFGLWGNYILLAVAVVNLATAAWNLRTMRRGTEALTECNSAALAYLEHAAELDRLLTALCTQAYIIRHAPIWQAWSQTMGDYELQVRAVRTLPDEDA